MVGSQYIKTKRGSSFTTTTSSKNKQLKKEVFYNMKHTLIYVSL